MKTPSQPTYTVSARKYRPQHWDAVVGQDGITRTLKQAIQQDQVAQAYLFCGPRGVGKTTSARIFARAINGFEASETEDYAFNVFELDAASNNKVEDIRSIVEQVRIPPQQGKYKVYVIDEVHMLSQAAFNAFLKTLEEPPPHAVFILATTEKHKILPTILSRCQIFDFHRITVPDMVEHLKGICGKEGIEAEEAALHVVAVKADGALRDALSIFDQLVAFAGTNLTYETVAEHLHVLDQQTYFDVLDAVQKGDIAKSLIVLDGIVSRGFDPHHFIAGLGTHVRNLLVSKDESTIQLMEVTEDVKAQFRTQSASVDLKFLVRALDLINQADVQYKGSNHQRLLVELTLMQMASLSEVQKKKPSLNPIAQDAWSSNVLDRALKSDADSERGETTKSGLVESVPSPEVDPPKPIAVASAPAVPLSTPVNPPASSSSPRRTPRTKILAPTTLLDEVKAPAQELNKVERTEAFSGEDVQKVWTEFVSQTEEEGQFNFYTTLKATTLASEGNVLKFQVLNNLQVEQIRSSQLDMMQFFSNALKNDQLQFEVVVKEVEKGDVSQEFMNDRERYDAMVMKNPALDTLRKRLDLDLIG